MQTPERYPIRQDQLNKYNQKCVCQICTCGKHHCPPLYSKFTGETTNYHDYKPYKITAQKHQPCQHHYMERHYDPEALKTSYQKDFKPFTVSPHHQLYKYQYKPTHQPFYGQTQYNKSYLPHEIVIQRPSTCTNTQYRKKGKFEGSTTYHDQFSPKKIQRAEQTRPIYERKKTPFYGETSYNSDYKPYQIQMRKTTISPQESYPKRQNKFLGESRYHEQFKPYKVEKQINCPIEIMPQRPIRCSPEKNHLNYSAEKHRWQ